MILAFDTYYFDNKAKTICVTFESWDHTDKFNHFEEIIEHVEEYIPGKFYRREMPCILSLLQKINIQDVEIIIIDGFVFLDDNGKLGLGGHLYQELDCKIPIIGVAKSNFASINKNKKEVFRGESKKPIYITSIGIDLDVASENIKNMSGKYRMPTLLKELDRLTKTDLI